MSVYIVSNKILSKNNYYKIGFTKGSKEDILKRYKGAFGETCKIYGFYENKSILKVNAVEKLIFYTLRDHAEKKRDYNTMKYSRRGAQGGEIFICELNKIKRVISDVCKQDNSNTIIKKIDNLIMFLQ